MKKIDVFNHVLPQKLAERIGDMKDIGKRVRDVEEAPDGSLWIVEDANPGALIHLIPKVTPAPESNKK